MAGLTWFELDVDFHTHTKTVALQVALKNPTAEAYVSRIWAYCYHHAIDRFEGPAAVAMIEQAAGWRGKTGRLVAALLDVTYLEREGDALVAHGVKERLGPHIRARRDAANRQRRRRDKLATSPDDNADVTRDIQRDDARDVPGTYALYKDRDIDKEEKNVRTDALGEWRKDLGSALAVMSDNPFRIAKDDRAKAMRADIEALGVDVAVDVCADAARAEGKVPGTGDWFAPILRRAAEAIAGEEWTPTPPLSQLPAVEIENP